MNPLLAAMPDHAQWAAAEVRDGDWLRRPLVPDVLRKLNAGGVKLIAEGRGLGNDRGTAP